MNEIKHPCFNTDEPCEFEVMYNQTIAERVRLRQINAQLVAALEDASFLLAQIGKFPGDLHQFMDSIIRSAQDARAALTAAKGE